MCPARHPRLLAGELTEDLATGDTATGLPPRLTGRPDGLEAAMREVPGIEDCWRVAGSEGYVLKVRVMDIPALEATIGALNRIRGVARTRTTVVLSTKWEGRHG